LAPGPSTSPAIGMDSQRAPKRASGWREERARRRRPTLGPNGSGDRRRL